MKTLIGKKLGMTQIFSMTGELKPVTVIHVEPNLIIEIKDKEKFNYSAFVVGYTECREKLLSKPVLGHFKKKNVPHRKKLFELKNVDFVGKNVGECLTIADAFEIGDFVDLQGFTKGHGFTGAIKLWNFKIGPKSHGAGFPHRYQGSLQTGRGGAAAQKVWKGRKMAGRYGNEKVTITNLEVVHIDNEHNLLFVCGAVPGRKNQLVKIKATNRKNKKTASPFELLTNEKN